MSDCEKCEKLESEIRDAWKIINTLSMAALDEGESYPKALEWLARNEELPEP